MKQLRTKINHFFIAEEVEVSRHDELWFYLPIALIMFIVMIVMISSLVTGV